MPDYIATIYNTHYSYHYDYDYDDDDDDVATTVAPYGGNVCRGIEDWRKWRTNVIAIMDNDSN